MPSYSTNLGLAQNPETKDPDTIFEFQRVYNAIHILQAALDTYSGIGNTDSTLWSQLAGENQVSLQNLTNQYVIATEDITAGMVVNLYNNSGTLAVRKALSDSTGNYVCRGFCRQSVTSGNYAWISLMGANNAISGLTPGFTYWLSDSTAGLVTSTPPGGTSIVQIVGFALSSTCLFVNPQQF